METIPETVDEVYAKEANMLQRKSFSIEPSQQVQRGAGGAAIRRMQEIAQGIYDSTPGINDEVPKHTSKILQNVKNEKKIFGGNTKSTSGVDMSHEMKYEDWQTKYEEILLEYKKTKMTTSNLNVELIDKQERYIEREQIYKDTIKGIENEIKDKSMRPLEQIVEKTEDQYLLEGIDIHDKEQSKAIQRLRKLQKQNANNMDGNTGKNIKELHEHHGSLLHKVDFAQFSLGTVLKKERDKIWETLDRKIAEIKEQLRKEAEKKKDNQYDFKEKEKELNEHLETMTQVAQNIDDDNRVLTKKNQELKIQYLSQENDRDLLLRQLIFQKKESAKLRETHRKMKKEADALKEAEKQDLQAQKLLGDKGKPGTAGVGRRMKGQHSQKEMGGSLKRPNTTAMGGKPGSRFPAPRPFTGVGTSGIMSYGAHMGGRAISANYAAQNPKLRRFENLIYRLKKILESEKKALRQVKTLCAKEIEQKNMLEKILRQCVDDVKNEIQKKRTEGKVQYYQKPGSAYGYGNRGQKGRAKGTDFDDRNLTKAEREKILEVLLSQERVLTLLYDKTFPPRPSSQNIAVGGARGLLGTTSNVGTRHAKSAKGFSIGDNESMRQFNYYGQTRLENLDEHDIVGLEKEIDFIMRNSNLGNRINSPNNNRFSNDQNNIININGDQVLGPNGLPMKQPRRHKTAGHGQGSRTRKKASLAAKRQQQQAQQAAGMDYIQSKSTAYLGAGIIPQSSGVNIHH